MDGDTIDVMFESNTIELVRLLGVYAPEQDSSNFLGEYQGITSLYCLDEWADRVSEFLSKSLDGETVDLQFGSGSVVSEGAVKGFCLSDGRGKRF